MKFFLLGICFLTAALIASAQQSQLDLADALRTAPEDKRAGVIASIWEIPAQKRQPYLVNAVVEEADRLRQDLEQRREGRTLPPLADEGEYLFQVLDTLAQHDSSVVIRPLVAFIATGNRVMDAIADFGEAAVTDVLIVASSRNHDGDAGAAIGTLRKMLERGSVRHPLSADSRRRIAGIASDRLRGNQTFAIVLPAVQLAVATATLP